MSVFRNVVFLAAAAGLLAGVVMSVLQVTVTAPLIVQAEVFENSGGKAATGHDTQVVVPATPGQHSGASHAAGHSHADDAWQPADGFERSAYTVLANVVTAIGFALLLVVVSELAGGIAGWREGLIWGLAGFAVFTLAPGLGLPPELPAMPAAELYARQSWWLATVIATAAGLALIVLQRNWMLAALGVALIITPHVIGAPQPADHGSPIPADLHHQFVVAATITSLLFWLVLGSAAGSLRRRFMAEPDLAGASASA